LDTSRRQWKAIVEAKIGSSRINPDQIRRYYRLARANGIDAIITISNELNVKPLGCGEYRPLGIGSTTSWRVTLLCSRSR
jgi:hypothetical protein